MDNNGFNPGWAAAVQGIIYLLVAIVSVWRTNKKTEEKTKEVKDATPSISQANRIESSVAELRKELHVEVEKLENKIDAHSRDVPRMIEKSLAHLANTVQAQFNATLAAFAKGQALSEKTVIKGDKS